jgi:hypothetical protein
MRKACLQAAQNCELTKKNVGFVKNKAKNQVIPRSCFGNFGVLII